MQKIYVIRDVKSEVYGTPYFSPNDSVAVRSFFDLAHSPDTLVNRHPEDFSLYYIGDYYDDSAQLQPVVPKFVASASDFFRDEDTVL